MRKILLAGCLMVGLVPGAASAATPFTAGNGTFVNPRVAVSETTRQHHIVWPSSTPGQIGYCRVAPGDSDCNLRQDLALPGSGPTTVVKGVDVSTFGVSAVVVHASCDNCGAGVNGTVFRLNSDNDGATFGAPAQVNITPAAAFELIGQGVLDDGGTFYVGAGTTTVHAMAGGGTLRPAVGAIGILRRSELAKVPGTSQLVFASSGATGPEAIQTSLYEGPMTPTAVNTIANWPLPLRHRPLPAPTPGGDQAALTAGPARLAMVQSDRTFGNSSVNLRLWDAAAKTFSPPIAIHGTDTGIGGVDAHTDTTGVLHAAWRSEPGGVRLRYRATATDGLTFGDPVTVAIGETYDDLAVGRDFAVWRGVGNAVRVVRLEALPADPPAGGGGAPPGGGGTPPGATPPGSGTPAPGSGLPGDPGFPGTTYPAAAPKRPVVTKTKQATYTFEVPQGCVRPGQRFRVTLKWKRAKKKGNVFVKVRRADFFLGSRRVKVDRKPVFAHTYRLQTSAKPGATVKLRSRAYIKVKRGKSPTKSIRTTVRVCSAS